MALHGAGVTFVLDRAGITGDDGPSHNGMWDIALTGIVPTLMVAAPRDEPTLRELLRESVAISDVPTLLRFPKGEIGKDIPAQSRVGDIDLIVKGNRNEILVIGVGSFVSLALEAAQLLEAEGIATSVVDPRWLKPISDDLVEIITLFETVIVLEDGITHAGFASSLSERMRAEDIDIPLLSLGIPLTFLQHSKRKEVLGELGLTPEVVAKSASEMHTRIRVRSF